MSITNNLKPWSFAARNSAPRFRKSSHELMSTLKTETQSPFFFKLPPAVGKIVAGKYLNDMLK